jgi:CIC family chloride channel protein
LSEQAGATTIAADGAMNYSSMKKRKLAAALLDRMAPPEGLLLLFLAVIIGGATGFAAVFFIRLIDFIQDGSYSAFFSLFPDYRILAFVCIPVAGSLVAGPIIAWFAAEAKGHGVPEVMQALVQKGGRIRPRVAIAKIFASALCIGTGGSAGREGPIVQVGSALGSSVGQVLRLSDERIKNLVSCGAAAGIAATFNAPIAGVAFAIEVLMTELQVRTFGSVVIAAVSASIVSQMFLGDNPAFSVPSYSMQSPLAIFLYLLLGLTASLVAIMFIRMLGWFEVKFDRWRCPVLLKPAVGAGLLGLLGVGYILLKKIAPEQTGAASVSSVFVSQLPAFYGSGFAFIEESLRCNITFVFLVLLIFLKPLATSFTLGSGNSGGVFAPSLFIGAMLGGSMGKLFSAWVPDIAGPPGAYALVGMAAVFAAAARGPFTGLLIVFEMSNDYAMILPLMTATVTASHFAQWLYPDSIYTQKLTRRGIRFVQGRDMDVMQGVTVKEVMNRNPEVVQKTLPLADLYRRFQETNFLGFPVLDEHNKLWGFVTLQDMERVLSGNVISLRGFTVEDVAVVEPVTVFADEPIWTAIQKMAPRDLARLPVISRDGTSSLVGLISRSNILRAYDVAIVRKQRGQMLGDDISLRKEGDNAFVELTLLPGDNAADRTLQSLDLPDTINVVSVERAGMIIIPKGSTSFAVGDTITVFGHRDAMERVREVFSCPSPADRD